MKTEVKKTGEHKRELTVQVQGDIVREKFNQVYKRINKEAKVPGFRSGNVPRDILEKHYSQMAQEGVLKELLPEVYNQALGEVELKPVSMPEISQVNLDKDNLSFKANFEVKPKIDLKNYKRLKAEYKPIKVSMDEVNQALDKLKKDYQQMSDQDFVHSLGYSDRESLSRAVERQIYLEKARTQQVNLENGIIQQLLEQVNFQIPPSLVNQQLERLTKQAQVDLALRGMKKEDIEKQDSALRESLKSESEKQVRIFLVLEEVARRENIALDDKMTKEVIEFLLRQADWKETN
ncbi:MAG: trigger factor [Candidatus Omnitrophota bacterium]|jgi:FKBP-type peptidyl-prolyl cis-trans isomerase (trigger factor)